MIKTGQKVGLRIAGIGVGIVFLGSAWSGAAFADDPAPADPVAPPVVTTVTSAPAAKTGTTGAGSSARSVGAVPAVSPGTAGDKDCRDFTSQLAAQAYFIAIGGSATNNADDLDANHNGVACEDYNYGTAATSSAATTPGVSAVTSSADKNCSDFTSQAEAQTYFNTIGGSATNNADDLDANHNGVACEDYNYATAGTTGSSAAGAGGSTAGPAQVSVVPSGGVDTGDGSFTR